MPQTIPGVDPTRPRVVVIGAGSGGVACAIALKEKQGYDNFTIYEKGNEVGGTWRANTYPGSSSDIPMAFYSLSTDLHDWKETHGSQEDIQSYWISVSKKYNLYSHIRFNEKVVSAIWDEGAQHYEIVTENTLTGVKTVSIAHVLISAVGILDTPRLPNVPGITKFKGVMFHSAEWDHSVDLKWKRVGVVGNGASATQFVPMITEDPTVEVLQFCRTPNWLLPPLRKAYSPFRRWLWRRIPFLMRLHRWTIYARLEMVYLLIWANGFTRYLVTLALAAYLRKTAPKKHLKKLVPDYPLGCKRILFDSNYSVTLSFFLKIWSISMLPAS